MEDTKEVLSVPATPVVKRRSLALAVLFSIITFGLYYLYWFVCITNDTNKLAKTKTAGGIKALIFTFLTCGLYHFYWAYMLGKKAGEIDGDTSLSVVCLVSSFFALSIIGMLLVQKTLNRTSEQ